MAFPKAVKHKGTHMQTIPRLRDHRVAAKPAMLGIDIDIGPDLALTLPLLRRNLSS